MNGPTGLTPRQREILTLLSAGKSNKDIANTLGIGVGTVKQHLVVLFRKLGVTSRSAAVAAAAAALGHWVGSDQTAPRSVLESRPATALSVVGPEPGPEEETPTPLQRILAQVASDFHAILLERPDGGDIVFGIRRSRENDAQRAVRAAFAVERLWRSRPGSGERTALRMALGSARLLASITRAGGGWSGEVLSGPLTATTRTLALKAPAGTLLLGDATRDLIAFAAGHDPGGVPARLPLDHSFRWAYPAPPAPSLLGREGERDMLNRLLDALAGGHGGGGLIEGEAGLGKTSLALAALATAAHRAYGVRRLRCLAPDSQPHEPSLSRVADMDSGKTLALSALETALDRPAAPFVWLLDDVHLLPENSVTVLGRLVRKAGARGGLLLLTGRPARTLKPLPLPPDRRLRLARLPATAMSRLTEALEGVSAADRERILSLAGGVPLFAVELGRAAAAGEKGVPLTLTSLIVARVDGLRLDRLLLRLVTRRQGGVSLHALYHHWPDTRDSLEKALDRAVAAGLVRASGNGSSERRHVAHPLVERVLQSLFPDQTVSFAPVFSDGGLRS